MAKRDRQSARRDASGGLDWERWLGPRRRRPTTRTALFTASGGSMITVAAGDQFAVCTISILFSGQLGAQAPRSVTREGGGRWETPGESLIRWKRFGNIRADNNALYLFSISAPRLGAWSLPVCEVELRGTLGHVLVQRRLREVVPDPILRRSSFRCAHP